MREKRPRLKRPRSFLWEDDMTHISSLFRDVLLRRPFLTHVALPTRCVFGRVEHFEESSHALGVYLATRQVFYEAGDDPREYLGAFGFWFNLPTDTFVLSSGTFLLRVGETLTFLRASTCGQVHEGLRRTTVEAMLKKERVTNVVSVVFRPGAGDQFVGIEHVSLGVLGRRSEVGSRIFVTVSSSHRIESDGAQPEALPHVLELGLHRLAYETPWGGAIVVLPEKVLFFDP